MKAESRGGLGDIERGERWEQESCCSSIQEEETSPGDEKHPVFSPRDETIPTAVVRDAVVVRYQVANGCRSAASCSSSGEIAVVLSARKRRPLRSGVRRAGKIGEEK